MRIVCISDMHTYHHEVSVPDGDILICAGDFTRNGRPAQIEDFARWFGEQPHEHKLLIAGNHDLMFEDAPEIAMMALRSGSENIIYLQDSEVVIDGVKFYGAPWQPEFNAWAFNLDPNGQKVLDVWAQIPDDTEVLVTHGPPRGILDECFGGELVGCEVLLKRIWKLEHLKLHVFGHIHESYGRLGVDGIQFVNAACCDLSYAAVNPPVVVEI